MFLHRLKNLSNVTKLFMTLSFVSVFIAVWYDHRSDVQGLLTSKMAVKQLDNSDASYLMFQEAQNLDNLFYGLSVLIVVITIILLVIEFKEEV